MIVRVKTYGASYEKGQKCVWDDVYFKYRIGRKTKYLGPCIMGRPDLKEHRRDARDNPIFAEDLWHAERAIQEFKNGRKHSLLAEKDCFKDRTPNVYVREKMVSKNVVERVAKWLIAMYDKYEGPLTFRYR